MISALLIALLGAPAQAVDMRIAKVSVPASAPAAKLRLDVSSLRNLPPGFVRRKGKGEDHDGPEGTLVPRHPGPSPVFPPAAAANPIPRGLKLEDALKASVRPGRMFDGANDRRALELEPALSR